jgi:PAS domain S-box-containing protein
MSVDRERTQEGLDELRGRLDQAEEALRAIRHGEVDALVVWTSEGDRVFTLQGADFAYRIIIESMSEGAASLSAEGIVLYANRRLAEMVATPVEEIVANPLARFVAADEREAFERLLERAASEAGHGEVRLRAADGRRIPTRVSLNPLPATSGAAVCVIATDITELRRAENELRAFAAELETRVQDRTAELEAFTFSVSHDLRAPLRAIDGFSRLLLDEHGEQLPAEAREHLARVRANTVHMQRLIDELLKLSRIGRRELEIRPVDVSALAAQAAEELCAERPERRRDIQIEPGMAATADEELVATVLRNLLDNAVKFTSKRTDARIEIGTRREEDTQVFFVRDNGTGFEMARAGDLFRPFVRLHTEAEYAGLGVGLATVKRALDRHGGRIWAQSVPGQGATFSFTLAPDGAREDTSGSRHLA